MRILFGEWTPDRPAHLQDGLLTADNVYASPDGYRPIFEFQPITEPIFGDFLGGATFVASDGTTNLMVGTSTDLLIFNNALAWDSVLGSLTAGRWYFTQFGDSAIAVHGGQPVDVDLLTQTAAILAGSPPTAAYCTTVRDFVVLGAVDGRNATVQWSGFNDSEGWVDGVNQSGSQDMLTGGPITGLAGGEYGLVFQRARITRMTYVGSPIVFQFDEISANVGCIAAGSIVQVGRLVYFLSERGFMVTDGNDTKPIGAEKVDRTFLFSYAREDLRMMFGTADPQNHLAIFSMPGRLWIFNWQLERWTTSTWGVAAVVNGFTEGIGLDDLDTLYPTGLDLMDPVSLDDPRFRGGSPLLLAVNMAGEIGTMTGDRLQATLELPFSEIFQGRTTRARMARPICDAIDGITLTFDQRQRLGDPAHVAAFGNLTAAGDIYCRLSGRFIKTTMTIRAEEIWSYAQGVEFPGIAAGGRR